MVAGENISPTGFLTTRKGICFTVNQRKRFPIQCYNQHGCQKFSAKNTELFLFHEEDEEKKKIKDRGIFHSGIPVNLFR